MKALTKALLKSVGIDVKTSKEKQNKGGVK